MEGVPRRRSYGAAAGGTNYPHEHDVSARNKNLWVGRCNRDVPPSFYSYETPKERSSTYNAPSSSKSSSSKGSNSWWWTDAERKRKRRVAKYKLYAAEGKFKHSVKKGLRWLKIKCIKIVNNF